MSRMTAMDIDKQEFAKRFRGFAVQDVRLLLHSVACSIRVFNTASPFSGEKGLGSDFADQKAMALALLLTSFRAKVLKERGGVKGTF